MLLAALPAFQQAGSNASDGTGQEEDVFELAVDDDEDYTEDEDYDEDGDDDDDAIDVDGIDNGGTQKQGSRGVTLKIKITLFRIVYSWPSNRTRHPNKGKRNNYSVADN